MSKTWAIKHNYMPDSTILDHHGRTFACVLCGFPRPNWRHGGEVPDEVRERLMREEHDATSLGAPRHGDA